MSWLSTIWTLFEVSAVLAFVFIIVCFVILSFCDADLLTIFWERFGAKPASMCGKVVWVTGASAGIGEHLAYQLTAAGCKVVLSARRVEELQRVKDACLASAQCKTKDKDIFILALDVAKTDTHKDAVKTVLDMFGQIDILLNNAGRGMRADWWEIEHGLTADRDVFDLNVFGTVSLTQHVLPHMMERRQGQIAVMSSILGRVHLPNHRAYVASKHALQGYFGVLRMDLPYIDVTIMCPGPVHSDFEISQVKTSGELQNKRTAAPRMRTERCAYLCCVALANRMFETWISHHPALFSVYANLYMHNFYTWIMKTTSRKMLEKVENRGAHM